jgi:Na+-transporting methylmalonyl-CoA/oxaloacetate decarboxylase gamma subunit
MGLGIVVGMVLLALLIWGASHVYNRGYAAGRRDEKEERHKRDQH